MRNAGPIESPTDPFASVPLPTSGVSKKPRIEGLPPGVSRDIFGPPDRQEPRPAQGPSAPGGPSGNGALPPVAPPAQPWPMTGRDPSVSPSPVFGLNGPAERPPLYEPEPPRRGRLLPGIVALVLLLGALAYVVPAVMMSGSVLRGTHVGGVDIGGLTVTQAADKLRAELASKLSKPVTADIGGKKETIQADEAGLELDVVGTIGQAPSGFPSPMEVWRGLTGTTELPPKISVDSSQLTRTIEGLAEAADKPAHEGKVTFTGLQPKARQPEDGVLLDREDAVRRISEAFLQGGGTTVVLTVRPSKPVTTPEAVETALAKAKGAVAGPITLTLGDKQAQVTPAMIAANLTFNSDGDGGLAPEFNAKAVLAGLESSLVDAAQQPRDATYQIVDGKPVLVTARAGRGVNDKLLARDMEKVFDGSGSRTIPVRLGTVAPAVETSQIQGLGIKEEVGAFTTSFDPGQPRVKNIQRMAQEIDGYVVKPGTTFSLNEVVGERTVEDGYVEAGQIVGGRMVNIVGGGGSQFATTLYNAVFFGGFEDVEHQPMDYYAPRYPAGRDVALLYPDLDLKWRNDSESGVLIKTSSTETSVTVTLWSTKRFDKIEAVESERRDLTDFRRETSSAAGCLPTVGEQGFTIDVTRVFFKDGKVAKKDKKLTTKYRPQTQMTCTAVTR
ncbi:Vancomycin resistance protein YoaR, contains peptidoglycan-binding and VanW domains [Nonomuraea solani]|uniref:Vancomycin resistance protein YoaR, contains peptidoglycan-binding and VanW domains n=1 Tax=Nonomuraea solani TaxID=1144553 RepID=A0A1H6EA55_9ACTN|nr:VanW family protein [Nonomuraea solani]SEG94161.1 Vancomycin resistance protein YoaR, contains peptidoglycan-binding and VanW domains [Nonomuraea solani]